MRTLVKFHRRKYGKNERDLSVCDVKILKMYHARMRIEAFWWRVNLVP